MSEQAHVAGVGMIPFAKPGQSEQYDVMAERAVRAALADAGLDYPAIQQAYVGFCFGDSCSGQQALYRVGLTSIPIFNVNNNCSTGSTALYLARQAVESGAVDVALAVGFEQMNPGAIGANWTDRTHAAQKLNDTVTQLQGTPSPEVPPAAFLFGGAGREYQQRYGVDDSVFARISVKARTHAARNPYAIFRAPVTLEEVMAAKLLYGPVTRLQSCPPTCGAAAAIVVSADYARRHAGGRSIRIAAQTMTTDAPASFEDSMISAVGYDMTQRAAQAAYAKAGIDPRDADVVELHDCFTTNEVLTYEALGLVAPGGAEKYIVDGDNTYGGRTVINPSGGLLSKGHPLGATGLAQCVELVWQLRGAAEARQVPDAKLALQHNIGLGGACVVTIYQR